MCAALGIAGRVAAAMPAPSPANLRDFDFMVETITRNYAGYDTKVNADTAPRLAALTARLRARAATASAPELSAAMAEWIGFFHDRHVSIGPLADDAAASASAAQPSRQLTEAELRARLAALGSTRDPVEGIWRIGGDRYRVGVLRHGPAAEEFEAVVLSTTASNWSPGQIKATLRREAGGTYRASYRAGDHHAADAAATLIADGAILSLGDEWGNWSRELPTVADPDRVARMVAPDELFLKRLSPDTLWLRIPDFHDDRAGPLRTLIDAHRDDLADAANLIIDVRRNGGGSDYVYEPLLPLLYTRPVYSIGIELRSSPANIALRRAVAEKIRADAPEQAAAIVAQTELMAARPGDYVQPEPHAFSVTRRPTVLPRPRHVAIMIDDAGSTGEQFLLDARQSRKVTMFGQRNSAGVLDFANVVSTPTPSGRFRLQWATSRSLRLPDDPVDPDGIAPDIRIPATETDPVSFARRWLERQLPD